MENKLIIATGLLLFTHVALAENEAHFDNRTGALIIPKVLIGSDYYNVNMKYKGEALDFEVTSYAKIKPKAPIETVDIQLLESFPVQVNVIAKGYFSNGCGRIDDINSEKLNDIFTIIITTKSEGETCTQALVPFEQVIPLDVVGLKAGVYGVIVNNIKETFELAIDN